MTREVIDSFVDRNPAVVLAESPETLSVQTDEALLKVLLQNLLDNAVKFSLKDSAPVEVRLAGGEKSVIVRIDDDGQGIPEDMTERVLEPFVKLDPSLSNSAFVRPNIRCKR